MVLEDEIDLWTPRQDFLQSPTTSKVPSQRVLVFFITGNPGLIEYYRTFLTQLSAHFDSSNQKVIYRFYGASLGGFELRGSQCERRPPFTLDEQAQIVRTRLDDMALRMTQEHVGANSKYTEPLPVILVGHSVGAYILLETISWRQKCQSQELQSPPLRNLGGLSYEIMGGICLFPTIVDIAKSSTGKIVTPFATLPGFALFVHVLAKVLSTFMAPLLLARIITLVNGMPADAASTTAAFIKSKYGVYQALYMAKHELLEMTNDKWSDNVWGAKPFRPPTTDSQHNRPSDNPQLYFYFGDRDHWIADATRDKIIATRAQTGNGDEGKPYMEIDGEGVAHDFCIRHSKPIAAKVAEYIAKIVESRY